jgi:hypothetical protein
MASKRRRKASNRSDCPGVVKSGRNRGRNKKGWKNIKGRACPVQSGRVADVSRYKKAGCAIPVRNAYEVGFKKGSATCGTSHLNGLGRARRRRRRR